MQTGSVLLQTLYNGILTEGNGLTFTGKRPKAPFKRTLVCRYFTDAPFSRAWLFGTDHSVHKSLTIDKRKKEEEEEEDRSSGGDGDDRAKKEGRTEEVQLVTVLGWRTERSAIPSLSVFATISFRK